MTELHALLGATLNDRYRVIELIGRGGAATVFKAEDERHHRLVAVKVFRGDLGYFGGPDRFEREIAILATLQHPHILPLLDSGMVDGQPYYVMPYVAGDSLRDRLNKEPRLETQDALRVLLEVADALRYAHEIGIVHRDIKPENILLSGRHALVADFGIARSASGHGTDRTTTVGVALGTPTYMAPEQAAADPNVDHRADLYALGIVGFEMLAGRPPFRGEGPAAILASQIAEAPPPLESLRPDLPPSLVGAINRCLAKRPDDRWPRVSALTEQLEPLLLPSGAVTPSAMVPGSGAGTRRRAWLTGGILGAAVLAVAAFLAFRPAAVELSIGAARRLSGGDQTELDPVLSPDGKLLAYASGNNGSMRIQVRQLEGGDPVEVAGSVGGNQRLPSWSPDGSRLIFQASGSIYRVPSLGGSAEPLIEGGPDQPAESPTLSPDGSRLAYTQGGEIRIAPIADPTHPTVVTRDGTAHSLAWSPDGGSLAYVSGNHDFALGETLLGNIAPSVVRTVSAGGGAPVAVTDGRSLATSPVWWDQRNLLYVSGEGGIRDIYLARLDRSGRPTGSSKRMTTGLSAHSLHLSADRRRLTVAALGQVANVWSLPADGRDASVRMAEEVTTGDQVVEDMDVLPVANWLVFDSNLEGNQDIYLQSARSRRPIQLTRDSSDDFGPTWSPNGKEVAYYSVRNGVRHLFVMRATGRDARQITSDSLQDHQPQWAPDGRRLVFYRRDGSGRDRIFTIERNPDSSWAAPKLMISEFGTGATWSRDGRWIAFSDSVGAIRVIPVDGGPSRVIATPAMTGGERLKRPQWLPFDPAVLARSERPGGQGGIWRIPIDGGAPVRVAAFDDPSRPVYRDDFATDGSRVYFTISKFDAALWLMDLEGANR